MEALISLNVRLLEQAMAVVEQIGRRAGRAYEEPCEAVFSATLGQHVRHCVEHYEGFLSALQAGQVLDYDRRPRDARLETDGAEAYRRLEALRQALRGLEPTCGSMLVREVGAVGPVCSSRSRELGFLASHTVHHFALMAVMGRLLTVPLPEGFGVAPATLAHRRALAEAVEKSLTC
jgi:hypothetical protein